INLDINSTKEHIRETKIKLHKLPQNSTVARIQKRCKVPGRPHAVYRKIGLYSNKIRVYEMAVDVHEFKMSSLL
ncbi:uS14 family ribosomal protein, partial [Francisella tularensis]|uniref:uS14 family ribosomal protein n=1 Tax=Francisella tularensis TaxID=263 RepID=UPI0016808D4D